MKKNSVININYDVNEKTTVEDIRKAVCNKMEDPVKTLCLSGYSYYIKSEYDFIEIENSNIKMADFLERFSIKNILNLYFVFSAYQGDIWREGQIRYYMPSHEAGSHNNPHVHVIVNRDYSSTIDIETGKILAGKIPSKYKKKITDKIMNNQIFLLECWNNMTDGLKVDINYRFGNVKFGEK